MIYKRDFMKRYLVLLFVISLFVNGCSNISMDEDKKYKGNRVEEDTQDRQWDNIGIFETTEPGHSIWIQGYEIRILEYLDDESMLVKLRVGTSLIQAVVPRMLEENTYVIEYENETWGGENTTYIRFTDLNKNNAIYFSCVTGTDVDIRFQEMITNAQESGREYEVLNDGKSILGQELFNDVRISEYDSPSCLTAEVISSYCEKNQMVCAMAILTDDEREQSLAIEYLKKMQFRRISDNDFVYMTTNLPNTYEKQMEQMYEMYEEIIEYPTEYLQTNYNSAGADYEIHFLYDFTNDGIPEIVFMGNPKWICIVGENNAINLSGERIVWLEDRSEFLVCVAWTGDVTWSKSKIESDNDGNMELIVVESEYLCSKYDMESDSYVYMVEGKSISEEKFYEMEKNLQQVDAFQPFTYSTDSYVATKTGFNRSVMRLNDERIGEE